MIEDKFLELYSPIQVDIIDRDDPGHSIPLQAAGPEHEVKYLNSIMCAFEKLQAQEDARACFTAPDQDWSEICEKIISVTRRVCLFNHRPYGVYSCESMEELNPEDVESLKWYCCDQWDRGWGEGYAHCPSEGSGLGLYIHFWQDTYAPLLTREQLEASRDAEQHRTPVTEITPDTFWTLLAQAKGISGQNQAEATFWLTEQLLILGAEQARNFHDILHGYMELADKFGLWNAAILMWEDGCDSIGFEDFRAWLIAQGKDVYIAALKDPDSLADVPDCEDFEFEDLPYVGDMACDRLTGRAAYVDIEPSAHKRLVAELRRDIVYGEGIGYPHEWSEVAAYLPRLTAQYLPKKKLYARIRGGDLCDHDDPDIQAARASVPRKEAQAPKKKRGKSR